MRACARASPGPYAAGAGVPGVLGRCRRFPHTVPPALLPARSRSPLHRRERTVREFDADEYDFVPVAAFSG